MFIKHYAPTDVNQALNFGEWGGGVRVDVNGEEMEFGAGSGWM